MPVATAPSPSELLASVAVEVEARIDAFLTRRECRWAAVDPSLAEPFAHLREFVLSGGKRLRPAFCLCGVVGAGGDWLAKDALDTAAALELLHAFALVHDDVMDGSSLRRGRAALHVKVSDEHLMLGWSGDARRFGEALAVLVGDLAFACADSILPSIESVKDVWDELRSELVMGQFLDVTGSARGGFSEARSLLVARLKSASYTVERPLHLGAALCGRLDELSAPYSAFARPLGEAFQLRDDLLGAFGDQQMTGKPVGDDFREGKPTVLLSIARRRIGASAGGVLARVGAPDLAAHEIEAIQDLMVECGARDEVELMIERRHAAAMCALDDAPLDDHGRVLLEALASRTLGWA